MILHNCSHRCFYEMNFIYSNSKSLDHQINFRNFTFYDELYLIANYLLLLFLSLSYYPCQFFIYRSLICVLVQQYRKFVILIQTKRFWDFLSSGFIVFIFFSCRLFIQLIKLNIYLSIFDLNVHIKLKSEP